MEDNGTYNILLDLYLFLLLKATSAFVLCKLGSMKIRLRRFTHYFGWKVNILTHSFINTFLGSFLTIDGIKTN